MKAEGPVRRYLELALPEASHRIRSARIRWEGELRLRPDRAWAPFTAVQTFTVDPPGFVWDARVRLAPLVRVHVRDGYERGRGSMRGRIAGLITVVDQAGTPEIAQSALARWLGEAVWFPAALRPREWERGRLVWQPLDERAARATVTDGEVTASGDFHFGPDGAVRRMSADRYRDVGGSAVLTPFEGVYGPLVERGGVRVPGEAEVAWLLPEGRFDYWRGRPVGIEHG